MKRVLGAFGIVDQAPLQVSETLRSLNMSHTFVVRQGVRYNSIVFDGLSKEQPVWPIIADSVRTLEKATSLFDNHVVYFVVDSRAALSHTNINNALWPENRPDDMSFQELLKRALMYSRKAGLNWELIKQEPSLMDYVNVATKPSFLNGVQSAFYKINPYQLRKEIQILCISYLAGYTTQKEMRRVLRSNLKFAALFELLDSDKARELRTAVEALKTKPIAQVVKETGFASFELLYLSKSAAQNRPT